jgi:hypothetical protein
MANDLSCVRRSCSSTGMTGSLISDSSELLVPGVGSRVATGRALDRQTTPEFTSAPDAALSRRRPATPGLNESASAVGLNAWLDRCIARCPQHSMDARPITRPLHLEPLRCRAHPGPRGLQKMRRVTRSHR